MRDESVRIHRTFYNRITQHLFLGYVSPEAYERLQDQDAARKRSAGFRNSKLSTDKG